MEKKEYKEKYSKKVNKNRMTNKKLVDFKWIIKITLIAFLISLSFSFLSEMIVSNVNILVSIILIIIVIFIGILFDMIGISVTVADIAAFNSMSTKRVRGSSIAVKFIKNSEKMSSFCNDVIGDICGIVSGALSSSIAIALSVKLNINLLLITLLITALVASATIGGKALGKSFAINKSNMILYTFSRFVSIFYK